MICAYCNAVREANEAPCPRCGAPSPLLGQVNAKNFQSGNMQSGNNWGAGTPAASGASNGPWDDVPQLSFSGPQAVPQAQWWSQQEQSSSQANWQGNQYNAGFSGMGTSGVQAGWNEQNGWQSAIPTPGTPASGSLGSGQWGSGQSWQNNDSGNNNQEQPKSGEQSLLPVPVQPQNAIQLQVQHAQGSTSMLMPVQNIEHLLPDLPEQEGSVYVPPMYTKPRAVIPKYRIISGFLSVIIVMLLLCTGAGYYAKASGKWDAFTRFTGMTTPASIKVTATVNIPDPAKTETGPGKDTITSATTTARIDPVSYVPLEEQHVFAPNTKFYVTYSVVTKKSPGKMVAKLYTNNIFDKEHTLDVKANAHQNGYLELIYPSPLPGKVELYWNDKLAYRIYFAVR